MADIKFSEFPKATISKDSDEIAILQDGVNKMIASPVLESKIINKTVSRVIQQGGASLNVINLKAVVPTYADLATITPTPELNDAYQVESDGLVYVYTDTGFQADGDGFVVQPELIGIVEQGDANAVSGGEVYNELYVGDTLEFPQGRMAETFGTVASLGYIYYDSRFLIADKTKLKGVNVRFRLADHIGTLDLVAISLNGAILHSETKVFSGIANNMYFDTNFNDLSTVNVPFFVGVRLNSTGRIALSTSNIEGFSFWKPVDSGNFTPLNFKLGLSLDLADGGVEGEIKSFYILTKSDTTKIQQSLNLSKKVVFDSNSVTIEDTIQVPSGACLLGVPGGTTINFSNKTAFNVEGKENVTFNGLKIKGTQPNYAYSMNGIDDGAGIIANSTEALSNTYQGSEVGILLKSSEYLVLENMQFLNINGVGLDVDYVGRDYIKGMKASKLFFNNSYKAINTKNEHEYSNYTDLMISLCQIGFDMDSGNLNVSNPIITRCRYGMIIRGSGANHAHGIVNGAEIKHHKLAGVLIDNVQYGHYFNGLMMQYANLEINNSRMITIPDLFFSNGIIKCTNTDKVGKNIITNLYNATNTTINNTGNLSVVNNINMTTAL